MQYLLDQTSWIKLLQQPMNQTLLKSCNEYNILTLFEPLLKQYIQTQPTNQT